MSESVRPKGVGFPETYHARDAIQTSDVNASLIPSLHRKLLKQGYAFKKGRLNTSWKKRFFELTDDGQLVYRAQQNGKVLGDLYITKDTQIESIGSTDSNFNDGIDDQVDVISMSDGKNSSTLNKRLDTSSSYPGSTFTNPDDDISDSATKSSFKLVVVTPDRSLKLKFVSLMEKKKWYVALVHVRKLLFKSAKAKRTSVYEFRLEHQAIGYSNAVNRLLNSCNTAVKTFTTCGLSVRDIKNDKLKTTIEVSIEEAHRLICLSIKELTLGKEFLQKKRDAVGMKKIVDRIKEACLSASFSCLSSAWKATSWLMIDSWSRSKFASSTIDTSRRFQGMSRRFCKEMLEIFQASSSSLLLDIMEMSAIESDEAAEDMGALENINCTNTIKKLRASIELLNEAKARLE